MKKIWKVAIYVRVSTDKKEQQESIPAQIESLKKWMVEKNKDDIYNAYNLVEIYIDEGFSGSTFDRKSFLKMKEDIKNRKIDMVITRDLSRFGRNYIEAGYYIEDYFKENDVRFVSVLDNVDTLAEENDIIPFKNIINEMYIKDCSRRIKDGLRQRMLRGSSIASKPPYGYKFEMIHEGNIKSIRLIPKNDETTEIVREIYQLYLQGWSMGKITAYLNNKGISPPYMGVKNFARGKFGLWTNNTIRYILTNPKYGGIMVQGRWKKISYKIKKIKVTGEDEWIIGGEFSGIVSQKSFYKVQELINKRRRDLRHKGGCIHLFSGVLKCGECGGSMCYKSAYKGYKCTNSQMGGGRCTAHSIKEEYLIKLIKNELEKYMEGFVNKDDIYKLINIYFNKRNFPKENTSMMEEELRKIDIQIKNLYLDKLNGIISERNFLSIISSMQGKQEILIKKKKELEELDKVYQSGEMLYNCVRDRIDKILCFEELDRFIIEEFIDKIVVSEDKKALTKKVDIYFKFENKLSEGIDP